MKQTYLLFRAAVAFLLLWASAVARAESKPAIVVWYEESELFSFFVSDNPEMRIEGGYAIIESDGEWSYDWYFTQITQKCSFSIPLSETKPYRLTFEQRDYTGDYYYCDPEMVDGMNHVKPAAPQFSMKDGILRVDGLDGGDVVSVSTTDGKLLGTTLANEAGFASMQLPRYTGIAVVRAGSINFKITIQ